MQRASPPRPGLHDTGSLLRRTWRQQTARRRDPLYNCVVPPHTIELKFSITFVTLLSCEREQLPGVIGVYVESCLKSNHGLPQQFLLVAAVMKKDTTK